MHAGVEDDGPVIPALSLPFAPNLVQDGLHFRLEAGRFVRGEQVGDDQVAVPREVRRDGFRGCRHGLIFALPGAP